MKSLIHRIQNNDEVAFEEIYQSFHRRVFCFALKYTRDPAIAKEITQQFFIKFWVNRHQLYVDKPLEGQLFIILRNLVIDEMRKMTRANTFTAQWASRVNLTTNTTEEFVLHNDLQEQLDSAIQALPPLRKKIFQLSREQGLTYHEIAEHLTISVKTVEAQISLALKTLRSKLNSFMHIFL